MNKQQIALIAVSALLLMTVTAGASVYFTKQSAEQPKPQTTANLPTLHKERAANGITWDRQRPPSTQQQTASAAQAARCDDDNIAGKAVGGVGGGVLGSMLGKGKGKTATTIAGTLGGAYVGGQAIPLHNATCR